MKSSGRASWVVPGLIAAVVAQAVAGLTGVLVAEPSASSRVPPAAAGARDPRAAAGAATAGPVGQAGAWSDPAGAQPQAPPRGGRAPGARRAATLTGFTSGVAAGPALVALSPPYASDTRVTGCFPPGPQCRTEAVSRAADGYSSALVAFTSPGGGTAPGAGSAQGYSGIIAEVPLRAPAHRAVISAVVDLTRAEVGHDVGPFGVPTLESRAELALQEVAIHSVCGGWGCFASVVDHLARLDPADGSQAASAAPGRRRLQVVVANPSGLMPAGIISVAVQIYARAELGSMSASGTSPDVGTVHAQATVRVEQIEATVS